MHLVECRGHAEVGMGAAREDPVPARSAPRPQHRVQDGRAAGSDGGVGSAPAVRRAHARRARRREADSVEGPLLGARAVHGEADREGARRASRHQGDRASRSAVRRLAGRRRQRLHRIHPEAGARGCARLEVGRRHRGPPRPSPCRRGGARENRGVARPVRLPLLDDVPRVAEPPAVGARLARRRRGGQ